MSIHCDDIKIKIEPGLFEFLEWYPELPDWFSIDDLISKRYSIDSQYEPIISVSDLKPKCAKETHEEYYQRCKEVLTLYVLDFFAKLTLTFIVILGYFKNIKQTSKRL